MENDNDERVWVAGPPDVPWWKFKLAGVAWKLTRGNPLPGVSKVPGAQRVAKWAFEVRVMSREFEEVDIPDEV